jgi:hypothetical protein
VSTHSLLLDLTVPFTVSIALVRASSSTSACTALTSNVVGANTLRVSIKAPSLSSSSSWAFAARLYRCFGTVLSIYISSTPIVRWKPSWVVDSEATKSSTAV